MEISEYTKIEQALATLRERYKGVVYDVTKREGMQAAKEARAEVKGYRVALEKLRQEIKAPALERCQAIDAEAKRITRELSALEDPIDLQIKAEEKRIADEKMAKERAEQAAKEAAERAAREAEQAKIAAERAEIERQRAEIERQKEAARLAIEAAERESRRKIEEAERAARMQREEAERIARAAAEAEATRLREIERAAREEREKAEAEKRALEAAKRAEADRVEAERIRQEREAERIAYEEKWRIEKRREHVTSLRGMLIRFAELSKGIEEFDSIRAEVMKFVGIKDEEESDA